MSDSESNSKSGSDDEENSQSGSGSGSGSDSGSGGSGESGSGSGSESGSGSGSGSDSGSGSNSGSENNDEKPKGSTYFNVLNSIKAINFDLDRIANTVTNIHRKVGASSKMTKFGEEEKEDLLSKIDNALGKSDKK